MAKTLNVRTSVYDVTATVVIRDNDGIHIVEHKNTYDTKSVRALKKMISNSFSVEGISVIAIEDIKVSKRVIVKPYRINATIEEIVAACINSGLDVIAINPTDIDSDNTDTDDNEDTDIAE